MSKNIWETIARELANESTRAIAKANVEKILNDLKSKFAEASPSCTQSQPDLRTAFESYSDIENKLLLANLGHKSTRDLWDESLQQYNNLHISAQWKTFNEGYLFAVSNNQADKSANDLFALFADLFESLSNKRR